MTNDEGAWADGKRDRGAGRAAVALFGVRGGKCTIMQLPPEKVSARLVCKMRRRADARLRDELERASRKGAKSAKTEEC